MQVVNNSIQTTGRSELKPLPILGFSPKEQNAYSLTRAIRNLMLLGEGKLPEKTIETEASSALEKLLNRPSQGGLLVPINDLNWNDRSYQARRDTMQAGQATLGGNLVDTELRSGEFIEALRSRAMVSRLGARVFSNLNGNIDIPRQSGTTTTYWLSEGETIPESNMTIDLVSLRPKTIACLRIVD